MRKNRVQTCLCREEKQEQFPAWKANNEKTIGSRKAAAVSLSVMFVMTDAQCFPLTTTLLHWKVWQTYDDDGHPIFIFFLGSTFSHVGQCVSN